MPLLGHMVGKAASAVAEDEAAKRKQDPTWYWFTRGLIAVTLVAGWVFILVQNKFHVDPPVVVVMLAYLAVVMTVTNLWRVGAAAVAADSGEDTWGKPLGERGELEREKRTLLKSIKEAEFDLAMGKLSKTDAEQLIGMYRARAIEVIKVLEEIDAGTAETPRQKIEREVAARLVVEEKGEKRGKKKAEDKKAAAKQTDGKAAAKTDDKAAAKQTDGKAAAKTDDKEAAKTDDKAAAKTDDKDADVKSDTDADVKSDDKVDAEAVAAAVKLVDKAAAAKAETDVDASATEERAEAEPAAAKEASP